MSFGTLHSVRCRALYKQESTATAAKLLFAALLFPTCAAATNPTVMMTRWLTRRPLEQADLQRVLLSLNLTRSRTAGPNG